MKFDLIVTFEREEIKDVLHYDLIASCFHDIDRSTSLKRAYEECFTETERKDVKRIYQLCSNWYLRTGTPACCKMPNERYELWKKLVRFTAEFCTAYGTKNINKVRNGHI